MLTAADFFFMGSKITVDGDCSNEKTITNLDSKLKTRHHFANKGP